MRIFGEDDEWIKGVCIGLLMGSRGDEFVAALIDDLYDSVSPSLVDSVQKLIESIKHGLTSETTPEITEEDLKIFWSALEDIDLSGLGE